MPTTYYVAKTGSDPNPGTSVSPRLTITAGAALLSPGDALEIRSGLYVESFFNNAQNKFPNGTGPSNLTTIRGAPGATVVWKASGDHVVLLKDCGSYTKWDNLEFDGSSLSSADTWKHFRQDGGTTTGLVFTNNRVHDGAYNNMFVDIHSSGWLFQGNTVFNAGRLAVTGTSGPSGNNMYLEGNNHIIRANEVYQNAHLAPLGRYGRALRIANNSGDGRGANNNLIEGNIVYGVPGQNYMYYGIIFGTGDNNICRNNKVYNCLGDGILLWQQGTWSQDNNRIYHNTIDRCGRGIGTLVSQPAEITNSKAKNNLIYRCGIAIDDPTGRFTGNRSNNLENVNPMFVNAP